MEFPVADDEAPDYGQAEVQFPVLRWILRAWRVRTRKGVTSRTAAGSRDRVPHGGAPESWWKFVSPLTCSTYPINLSDEVVQKWR